MYISAGGNECQGQFEQTSIWWNTSKLSLELEEDMKKMINSFKANTDIKFILLYRKIFKV